jgi:hypothetical protein
VAKAPGEMSCRAARNATPPKNNSCPWNGETISNNSPQIYPKFSCLNHVSSLDAPYRYNLLARIAEKFEISKIIGDHHIYKNSLSALNLNYFYPAPADSPKLDQLS